MNRIFINTTTGNYYLIVQTLALLIFLSASTLFAQLVDPSFDPAPGIKPLNSDPRVVHQSDGKVILFGYQTINNVSGNSVNQVARLNSDGTFDTTFRYKDSTFSRISSVQIQSDGKIILAGSSSYPPKLVRLHTDGRVDLTFSGNFQIPFNQETSVWGIQPDGKIIASFNYLNSNNQERLFRVNTDGSIDNSFQQISFNRVNLSEYLYDVKILADGKILVAGSHSTFGKIFRLNSGGTIDNSFTSPVLTYQNNETPLIHSVALQSTGKIVIFGDFLAVAGVSRSRYARLNADGSHDTAFTNASLQTSFSGVKILSDDTIITSPQVKLTAEGAVDKAFMGIAGTTYFTVDSTDRIIASQHDPTTNFVQRIARFNIDGVEDSSFAESLVGGAVDVNILTLQADEKMLIHASFMTHLNGVRSDRFLRLNNDGTADPTFNHTINMSISSFTQIVVQGDGKILISGLLGLPSGQISGIARLNSDGSLDNSFSPALIDGNLRDLKLQSDGKILAAGQFANVGGQPCGDLARINTDGSRDTGFQCPLLPGNTAVYSIEIFPNGQILIGGFFSSGINGVDRRNLALLNADGTVDTSFNVGLDGSFGVSKLHRETNGKILYVLGRSLGRLNPNGSGDSTFLYSMSQTYSFNDYLVQPDGTILVTGLETFNSPFLFRLRNNGTVDHTFYTGQIKNPINTLARQADGQIILAGRFTKLGDVDRSSLARVDPSVVQRRNMFDFDGDGKDDVAVFRPSENKWYLLRSSDFGVTQQVWGTAGDLPHPGDYDGDGKTDISIFRSGTSHVWHLYSSSGYEAVGVIGQNGDIQRPSDFNGDGRTDYVFYRPSNFTWYRSPNGIGNASNVQFGAAGDKPLVGDFDGDGRSDVAIYRPTTGDWWWQSSLDNIQRATHWGIATDIPSPGDYDGDGITDFAVYRPETGVWYVLNSSSGNTSATIIKFGIAEDKPVPADYDGDGRVDIAVYRPSTGVWYLLRSTDGFQAIQFGVATDIPIPNALIP